MTITLSGYLRSNPGGAAISGKTINLLDQTTDLAPVTTTHTNLSATSAVTDASGFWSFTMDLGTGPLYVKADLGGGNFRYRRYNELFYYGATPISNLPKSLRGLSDGVIDTRTPGGSASTELAVTPSATRVLTISAGYAMVHGFVLGWDSGTKVLTGNANGSSGTTRYDFVVLRQWYAGSNAGKQDIVLVEGGSSTDPVATTTESDLTKFIRGATIWDVPIARAKLAFGATVYTVDSLRGVWPYPFAGQLSTGDVGALIAQSADISGALSNDGDVDLRNGGLTIGSATATMNKNLHIGSGKYVKSEGVPPIYSVTTSHAGSGATAEVNGTDRAGTIILNPGATGRSSGRLMLFNMVASFPDTDYGIWLEPMEETAIDNIGKVRAMVVDEDQWELEALDTISANQHIWRYLVEGF